MGVLKVRLISGRELEGKDANGLSDPYCKLAIGSERKKSRVKKKNLSPIWDETFSFNKVNPEIDQLLLQVFDHAILGRDDSLGWCSVLFDGLVRGIERICEVPLQGVRTGRIQLGLTSMDFGLDKEPDSFQGNVTGYEEPSPPTHSQSYRSLSQSIVSTLSDAATVWQLGPEMVDVVESEIGKGAYGVVYKGTIYGKAVAIKKLNKQQLSNEMMDEFIKEICVLCKIRHPNVVLFMGACSTPGHLAIVTEYLPRGSMERFLKEGSLTFFQKFAMAKDVVLAMNWLHCSQRILHLDLKPANLLVDENWNVKLADFGLACLKTNAQSGHLIGTPWFMAPEILLQQSFNEKADVYSFAIVLWTMYTNQLSPYQDRISDINQLVDVVGRKGERPIIPDTCPAGLANVLKNCWKQDSRLRPSFQQLLESCEIDDIVLSEIFSPSQTLARKLWTTLCTEKVKAGVTWVEFLTALKANLNISKLPDVYEACLKALLAPSGDLVFAEKFAQIVEWIGPLQPGLGNLDFVVALLGKPEFFGQLNGKQAETSLKGQPPGTYLLRFSTTQLGDYAISVVTDNGTLIHYRIERQGTKYIVGDAKYDTLFQALKKPPPQLAKMLKVVCPGSPYRYLFAHEASGPCIYEHLKNQTEPTP